VAGTLLPLWALQLQAAESDRPVGRIQDREAAWRALLPPDSFLVLATREGFKLELWKPPPLRGRYPQQFPLPPEQTAAISLMVTDLVGRGVLSILPPLGENPTCSSLRLFAPVFAVPKKGSVKMRPIYDARFLNRFIRYRKFKLESLMIARDLVRKEDFFCKIDLKDAYFHMTVHPEHRRLLCFRWEGKEYAYNGIPFGVSSAPRLFTKLMRPVIGSLRSRGIRAVIYLDDILLFGRSAQEAESAAETAASLLHSLGFLISWEKSVLSPTQQIEFLGVVVDSVTMEFRLSANKLQGLRTLARSFLREAEAQSGLVRTRRLSQVIGSFTASMPAVQLTRLKTRSLHRCLKSALARGEPSDPSIYATMTTLTAEAVTELRWWHDALSAWNGRSLVSQAAAPAATFASDASDLGWGMTRLLHASAASCRTRDAQGFWTELEQLLHNNPKELLGVSHGLQAWIQHLDLRDATVHVHTDNTTALSYIRKQGGRVLEMGTVAERLWEWCLQRGIRLTASHVPGVLNVRADRLSRISATPSECRLTDGFFRLLVHRKGPFTVDLFASRLNNRLPRYFSRYPDPHAAGVDALLQPWAQEKAPYCFPPFALIGRTLKKLELEGGRMVIVVPHWPTQPWWPVLLSLAVGDPIPLPRQAIDNPAKSDALPPDSTSLSAWTLSAHGGRAGAMPRRRST